jgi:hypothetical protein
MDVRSMQLWQPLTLSAAGRRPIGRGKLLLVQVARLRQQTRELPARERWWCTPHHPSSNPTLNHDWRACVRRIELEQTYRFLQTTPQLDAPTRAPSRPG